MLFLRPAMEDATASCGSAGVVLSVPFGGDGMCTGWEKGWILFFTFACLVSSCSHDVAIPAQAFGLVAAPVIV
jgi:hypothetical protein